MSGCTPEEDPPAAAAQAPSAAAGAPSPAAPSPSSVGLDATTKKVCENLLDAVKETAANVAKAEKIGPPAGHFAVGAAYLAGSAQMSADSIGGTDERVQAAADRVSTAMSDLDAAQQKDPEGKPSKAKLKAAVTELKAACS
ncbi:hypothetical protein [Actinoplanes sp. NPDC049118]|uniref:hypothetical protein n=1 Tax=Actinoplanes sp. NPDC049118 TaxID=3155769 RepID=UPI0033CBEBF0